MPRRNHIPHSELPYHVTARSQGGHWFHTSPQLVWDLMSDYLYFISIAYDVRIHSFVLMSNHFHLIVTTPEANLSKAMNYFMRETSKELNRMSGEINHAYGNRYFRSIITHDHYFRHVYKYVYRNPVTAKIADRCEQYKYSSLRGLLGQEKIQFPVVEDPILFNSSDFNSTMEWLNTHPSEANYCALKKAIQKKEMKVPQNKWVPIEKKHTLEMHPY